MKAARERVGKKILLRSRDLFKDGERRRAEKRGATLSFLARRGPLLTRETQPAAASRARDCGGS
eukprot:500328-Lingulodinium_polyedra.AAC.1